MNTFTGCLPDTREQEEKQKDWHKDTAMSGIVEWKNKTFNDIKSYPVRNQNGSGSCVAQSLALIMGIENLIEEGRFIEFSAKDIYTKRSNESGGMIGVEALDIVRKQGATLECFIPSQNMTEKEMNRIDRKLSDKEIAKIFTIKDYYQLPFNATSIASIMGNAETPKPVMVWFQFPRAEWTNNPQLSSSNYDIVRHSVTAIDYGILNGVKGIFVQDSWGLESSTNFTGLRFISEDYIKNRMIFCAYVNDNKNDYQSNLTEKPTEKARPVLRKGSKGEYVKELQKMLGIKQDGDFGTQTFLAVFRFQKDNGLESDGVVGKKTWTKLFALL